MAAEQMIVLDEFCSSHRLEITFLDALEQHGLMHFVISDQRRFVALEDLPKLERIVRLHQELNINAEGIDAIHYLLQRLEHMEHEMTALRNRLDFYEGNKPSPEDS